MERKIAFISDFGESFYVGQVKGIIKSINSNVEIIDIAHNIPKFNIKAGQFVLYTSYKYFPKETIFLAVIDPGVGSQRRAIAIESENYYFVGPDNGLFGFLKNYKAYEIEIPKNSSYTFHARDVFGPFCAKLSKGYNIKDIAKPIEKIIELDFRKVEFFENFVIGEVIFIDDFGNLITNIEFDNKFKNVEIKTIKIQKKVKTYSQANKDELVFLKGSSGFLEISVVEGNASEKLNVSFGEIVKVYF
ncbi:MAG: SAM-dependent chlorinase/fluorinase [candidate division WOR-3 bacterium]